MKVVLFISKGEKASSTRYRALQYFPYLVKDGFLPKHTTISGGFLSIIKTLILTSKADVVVLLRKTFPYPIFWILRKLSKKLIFDFDDAIFCNTDGSYSETRMSRFICTVAKVDRVMAGNSYLAENAKKFQTNTFVIPTSLDTQKYNKTHKTESEHGLTLVWIGSQSTKKYISGILPEIEEAATQISNLTLKIIADFEIKSKVINIVNIPWSEATEAEELYNSDIGLAPLPEDNWTKGKCALKVLQYMAVGIPVISSPTSVNGYVVEHEKSGFIATTASDWVKFIKVAAQSKHRLPDMGSFGQARVIKEFDISIVYKSLKALL